MESSPADLEMEGTIDGKVTVRFPPEPSGYLHIGHAKALLLNRYFADKYHGKMIIRFDDTNPMKEEKEFEESIMNDITLICDKWDLLSYTSDYFEQIYKYAMTLISKGLAYADDTDVEQMRKNRFSGIASKARSQTPEEAMKLFDEMSKCTEVGSKYCLRAKIDMTSPNKALRDPVIYRCVNKPHHRTGNKWKVYPTYDFCCPIVDSIEGVTHALRTIEYTDRNSQYQWFLDSLNLPKINVWGFSRLNFMYTLLSKRKLKYLVEKGIVSDWDDPRFPTIRGIIRRGLSKESLKKFILSQGPSQNNLMLEWDKIWAINKKDLEPNVARHTALNSDKIVHARIIDSEDVIKDVKVEKILKNKKKPEMGYHKIVFSPNILLDYSDVMQMTQGEEVTLMDWGNAIVKKLVLMGSETVLELSLNLEGDFKKTKKKLTWLSEVNPEFDDHAPLSAKIVEYDHIITKKKLAEDDNIDDYINKNSEKWVSTICDANIKFLRKGDVIQFQRRGLFILDEEPSPNTPVPIFINIPDGKRKPTETPNESRAKK